MTLYCCLLLVASARDDGDEDEDHLAQELSGPRIRLFLSTLLASLDWPELVNE